jgi:hypothetical protein
VESLDWLLAPNDKHALIGLEVNNCVISNFQLIFNGASLNEKTV